MANTVLVQLSDGLSSEPHGILVATPRTFSSGSSGFYAQDKVWIDGVKYQAQVQLVKVGSKPVA